MPLEYCFVPSGEDQDAEYDHALVEYGEGIWFENYASGQREIFGLMHLALEDKGFIVFPKLDDQTDIESLKSRIAVDDLPEFIGTLALDENNPLQEIDVDDGEGASGTFRVRYVGSQAITCSKLIPKLLTHPN